MPPFFVSLGSAPTVSSVLYDIYVSDSATKLEPAMATKNLIYLINDLIIALAQDELTRERDPGSEQMNSPWRCYSPL